MRLFYSQSLDMAYPGIPLLLLFYMCGIAIGKFLALAFHIETLLKCQYHSFLSRWNLKTFEEY